MMYRRRGTERIYEVVEMISLIMIGIVIIMIIWCICSVSAFAGMEEMSKERDRQRVLQQEQWEEAIERYFYDQGYCNVGINITVQEFSAEEVFYEVLIFHPYLPEEGEDVYEVMQVEILQLLPYGEGSSLEFRICMDSM